MSNIIEKASEAVADLANALGSTTISDKDATAGGDKSGSALDAVMASAAEGRRLYIGNLAYATTEGELAKFFEGFLIESTSIPKNPRTDRPVGYAFVDLSTSGEAERAIAELSGKEILERKVSVQLARKPEPAGEKTEGTSGGDTGSGGESGRRRSGSGRGRGRGRGRNPRGSRTNNRDQNENSQDGGEVPASQVLPLTDITNQAPADKGSKKAKPSRPAREPRERRERGPPADGIPSKVKVMVANLPYDLTEDKLKELFESYQPTSAKIALRPIPRFMVKKLQARNEPRKGRGFGFVTLASEEQQRKAVEEMNGKDIEGRGIAVKVAIDSPDKTDDDNAAPAEAGVTAETTNGTVEATATA